MRIGDLSIAELGATDQKWLYELMQAQTAWINGRIAGGWNPTDRSVDR